MMLQKIYISNTFCSFELSIHKKIVKEKNALQFRKKIKQIRAANQHMKGHVTLKTGVMAAENSALPSQK